MHRAQEQVRDFHRAIKASRPARPLLGGLTVQEAELRLRLIKEEFLELCEAQETNSVVAQIGELCDLLYVVYGYFVALGVDADPYFEEVHRANMEKVGGPRREDGKQLKPPGWIPPDLEHIFYRLDKKLFQEETS